MITKNLLQMSVKEKALAFALANTLLQVKGNVYTNKVYTDAMTTLCAVTGARGVNGDDDSLLLRSEIAEVRDETLRA